MIVCVALFGASPVHAQSKKKRALEHYEQAEAYMKTGSHRKAIEEYEAAYALVKKPGFLFNIGLAYEAAEDEVKAVEYFDKYVKLAPKGSRAKEARARAQALRAVAESKVATAKAAAIAAAEDPAKSYKEGVAAYNRRDAPAAIAKFRAAERNTKEPKLLNDIYWHWAATYRDVTKEHDKSLEYYRKCENSGAELSDWPSYWCVYMQGIVAYDRLDGATAIKHFARAETPGSGEWGFMNDLYYYWGAAYRDRLKDNAKALEYYKKSEAVSEKTTDWPAYWAIYLQGIIALDYKQGEVALEHFARAEKAGAAHWTFLNDVYYHVARTHREVLKDPKKALQYYKKTEDVSENPADWPGYWGIYLQGVIAHERKDATTALQHYARAEKHGKAEWTFMNDLYYMWAATYRDLLKDNAQALVYYKKCEQVSQNVADHPAYWAIYLQGVIAYERQDAETALERFATAEKAGAAHWSFLNDVYWYMAETYRHRVGDPDKALAHYQKAERASQNLTDWPGYWAIYLQGVIAYERKDAGAALAHFARAEPHGKDNPLFLNDLYWYWAATYYDILKDKAKAWEFYVKCETAVEDPADWPSYWCIHRQGVIAKDAGDHKLAGERFRLAEGLAKNDGAFQAEMSRLRTANPTLFKVPSRRGCGCSLPARERNAPGTLVLAAAVALLACRRSRSRHRIP